MNEILIDDIMDISLQAGVLVLENGGETYRAEETCVQIARAMGAGNASAFVTPTVVIVTVTDYLPTLCWPTKSTVHRPRCRVRCSKLCRSVR